MSTFVTVGNATQPFNRMLDAVCAIAKHLPQPVVIQYGATDDFSCSDCEAVDFMGMREFDEQISNAELLIMHAGAGSVINAVRSGKTPVVMPRRVDLGEHVDDHQIEFCRQLGNPGKILIAHDLKTLGEACDIALSGQNKTGGNGATEPALVCLVRDILERESH